MKFSLDYYFYKLYILEFCTKNIFNRLTFVSEFVSDMFVLIFSWDITGKIHCDYCNKIN